MLGKAYLTFVMQCWLEVGNGTLPVSVRRPCHRVYATVLVVDSHVEHACQSQSVSAWWIDCTGAKLVGGLFAGRMADIDGGLKTLTASQELDRYGSLICVGLLTVTDCA